MSSTYCCVPDCARLRNSDTKVVLHQFPNPVKDQERFTSWVLNIGGDIIGLDNQYIFLNRRVCHNHFEEKYICRYQKLSNIAVPTLHMPDLKTIPTFEMAIEIPRNRIITKTCSISEPSITPTSHLASFAESEKEIITNPQENHYSVEEIIDTVDIHKNNENKAGKFSKRSVREKKWYQQLLAWRVKLSKAKRAKRKLAATITALKKVSTNPALLEKLERLPCAGKILFLLQLRETLKKGKGRRFTQKEKILAPTISKQSLKAYRYLRKIVKILPTPQVLIKLVQKANIKPGINKIIFDQLKTKSINMKVEERLCILMFDEMSLKPNLFFSEKNDEIIGLTQDGKFIDHAQVFMIKGLLKNYKQPIYYSFANAATKGIELAQQIRQVIEELQKANFIVVALVSDQGNNNRQAINILINRTKAEMLRKGEQMRGNFIILNGQKIFPLYDPPHLLKGMRNNLITKNLKFTFNSTEKIAKWNHLLQLHQENPGYRGIRLVPKLTDMHVLPIKINKMKVKYAAQIFSRTVSANLGYLADKGILPSESKDTADMLLLMDNIFDSVNGSFGRIKNIYSKPLLGPVRPHSIHHSFWNENLKVIKSMKYVNASGTTEPVLSIKNWVWTIEGITDLLTFLNVKYNVKSVWLRHLNQDALENFFGAIRSHGCRNTNPTPCQFQAAFATLLLNNISSGRTPGANCENEMSTALQRFIIDDGSHHKPSEAVKDFNIDDILGLNLINLDLKNKNVQTMASLKYVSGYFFRQAKIKLFHNCKNCIACLTDGEKTSQFIKSREYKRDKSWLCYPNRALISVVSEIQDITYYMINKDVNTKLLKEYIKTIAHVVCDVSFINCIVHKDALINFLLNTVSKFFIFQLTKHINKVLCGRKQVDDESGLELRAKQYYLKCCKRKK